MINHGFNKVNAADGSDIELYAAFPDHHGSFPAVILFQEAFGITDRLRSVAENLCKKGYAVAAPNLFNRITGRLSNHHIVKPVVITSYEVFIKDGLTADLQASYKWLLKQDEVIKGKIGCAGFFSDGRVSFLADTISPHYAAACLDGRTGNFPENIPFQECMTLFYDQDPEMPSARDEVGVLSDTHQKVANIFIPEGDHHIIYKGHSNYSSLAVKEDWALTLSFFDECLKL
jgi:carboxymethylenebutenolidase